MLWIIFLLVIGLLMVCLEIFIPGGIVGTLGGFCLLGSIVMAFTERGETFGFYWTAGVVLLTLIGLSVSIRFLPRSPAGKRLFLGSSEAGFASGEEGLDSWVGKEGKAMTTLRPAGMIEIEGKRVDVVTGGEYLKKGTPVRVIRVDGNRVVVAEESAPAEAGKERA
jgi:membrane-bound ClpP family serine protease